MYDTVEDIYAYREMVHDAREEGRKEGLKEGMQKALLSIVRARFPRLEKLARGQAAIAGDEGEINDLIVKVSMARDAKEVKRILIGDEDDEG